MKSKGHPVFNAIIKFLLVFPVVALLMITISSCRNKQAPETKASEEVVPPPPPPPYSCNAGDTTWSEPDHMPVFAENNDALREYIRHNIKYPADAIKKGIEGQVVIRFVVDTDGKVDKNRISILKGVDPYLDQEAFRVIGTLPSFEKPGYVKGRPVKVWYILPVTFALK